MNRAPVYAENSKHLRIVSRSNGRWALQELGDGEASRTFDPWIDRSRECDFNEARTLLKTVSRGDQ
jgi:hypothetical protein